MQEASARPASRWITAADRDVSLGGYERALSARDRASAALQAMPPSRDGTTRLLASMLVDGERLMREVDVIYGAHVAGVQQATT